MKIATMVRGYLPAPRPSDIIYAPIDLAVLISEGLAAKGHAVEFYGPEGTRLNTAVQTMGLRPLVESQQVWSEFVQKIEYHMHYVPAMWDFFLAREMFERAREGRYDLLHFHHPEAALPFAALYPDVPIVYTQHDPLYPWYCETYSMYRTDNQHFVTISDSQRRPRPNLPYVATVHNGIDIEPFEYSASHDDYLLFVGRIIPEKGLREAVQVAVKTDSKLLIIGQLYPDYQDYFDEFVKPYLGEKIQYIGYVERDKLSQYYRKAKALLIPIQWEEPFGLTMVEAMACGTPILAFRRGSVSEIVSHGHTGYIVDTIDEMANAVTKVDTIDRMKCRRRVERKFTVGRMINDYEAVFKDVIKRSKKARRQGQRD